MMEILKWFLLLITILSTDAGGERFTITGTAMEPALKKGQTVIVMPVEVETIQRFDLVLYQNPDRPDELYIQRVIGLPGETIEIRGAQTFINGEALEEPFKIVATDSIYRFRPVTIADGHYFVIGDNRPNSRDSRVIGPISTELIQGKVESTE